MSNAINRKLRRHLLTAATTLALCAAAGGQLHASDTAHLATEPVQQFIVKYRDGSAEQVDATMRARSLDAAARALDATGALGARGGAIQGLQLRHARRMGIGADVIRADRALSPEAARQLVAQLAADPNVEYVEADRLMRAFLTPNDPRYNEQWGFHHAVGGIRAPQAWDRSTGDGIVVAIVDSGIIPHPDLDANSVGGYDFIASTSSGNAGSCDGDGRDADPFDACGILHGVHVAGTVAALTNNGVGVAGTAPDAKLLHLRVLGRNGYGSSSDIIDAITWASGGSVPGVPANQNPAEVINLSLGGGGACGSAYQNAINGAVGRGSTVVVAAGNSNANVANFSPGNCNNVISVASNDQAGARSIWGGGQASNYGNLIDIAAPGTAILSTYRSGSTPSYASNSGTSMAAPHVAGVVALMQAAAATPLSPAEVESVIKQTARAFPSTPDQPIGSGILDANAAVAAVQGDGGGDPGPGPGPGPGELGNGVPVTGVSGSAGSAQHWTITVPAGASNLSIRIAGGTGDADLYVRRGAQATTAVYDCRPYLAGNTETCTFAAPQAGVYHVSVRGYSAFSGVTLTASYQAPGGGGAGNALQNGVPVSGLSGAANSERRYTFEVPAGVSNLSIRTTGGSGDADLYVRRGAAPTTTTYDCRPYLSGNNETCSAAAPQAGTYHVLVRGYSAYSGVSLTASYAGN